MKAGQDQTFWEEKGWMDPRPSRLVSVVHSVFFRQAHRGRPEADLKVEGGHGSGPVEAILLNKIAGANAHLHDTSVSPVVRQTLLHCTRAISPPFSHCPLADSPPPCLTPTRAKRVTRSRRRTWSAMSREGEKAEAALLYIKNVFCFFCCCCFFTFWRQKITQRCFQSRTHRSART